MFILTYAYFFLFQLEPTNEGVHKGPQNLATPLTKVSVCCYFEATSLDIKTVTLMKFSGKACGLLLMVNGAGACLPLTSF